LALLALFVHRPIAASAAPITIDFETLLEGTDVGSSFAPDVTFTDAIILTAGSMLDANTFPPHSGTSLAANSGGPVRLDFAAPLASFSGYFTYNAQLTIEFFDASSTSLGTVVSASDNNLATSGVGGNELLSAVFPATFLTIDGAFFGSSFTLDDISFQFAGSAPSPVPEPGTLVLVGSGAAVWVRRRWKSVRPLASHSTMAHPRYEPD